MLLLCCVFLPSGGVGGGGRICEGVVIRLDFTFLRDFIQCIIMYST